MKNLISKMRNNIILKRITYWCIVAFLFLYTFSIPAFSGREKIYIVSYFFMAALGGFTIVYTFLYTKFKFNRWLILPALFVAFAFLGTAFYSHSFVGTSGKIGWTTLLLMLITLVVFYYAFVAINNNKIILIALLAAFLVFAFYFAYVYRDKIIHLQLSSDRIDIYFDNQNTIGFYFAIAYALSLFCGLFYKRKLELLYLIPAALFLFLGLFTGSRAFLVSVVIGSIVIMYLKLRNHKIIFLIALGCLIGLLFVLINISTFAFLKDQFDRTLYTLFGIGNSKVDTSTVQRAVWPGYAFYLGGRNLIFGYGVNGFSIYSGVGTYSHNNFAEVLCNFGIIGFVLFNACLIIPFLLSFKPKSKDLYLVSILFFVYVFRSLFGVVYYSKETYLVLALIFYLTRDCKLPVFGRIYHRSTKSECYEVNV